MNARTYIDGIESISVVDGIARLELFAYKAGARVEGQKEPEHVAAGELVISLNGLVRLHGGIGRLLEDMKKRAESKTQSSDNFPAK